jgi:hypothetical protein
MDQRINGMQVRVPVDADGTIGTDDLRRVGGIRQNRPLILQQADGTNRFINPGERLRVKPGQYYLDAPLHDRGQ